MIIENRIISIASYKCDIETNEVNEIINNSNYPIKTDYYTYGIIKTSKVDTADIFTLVVVLNSTRKELTEKNGTFEFVDVPSKTLYSGDIFYLNDMGVFGLINSNNIIFNTFKNLITPHELNKFVISDDNYSKLERNSLIKTSCGIVLKKPSKNFKMNISSETLDDQDMNDLFGNTEFNSFCFNGRIFQSREISFKINKNGNVIFYNSPKNPLELEDVFEFMKANIY